MSDMEDYEKLCYERNKSLRKESFEQMVPREPTEVMIREGMCEALTVDTYKAMITAYEKEQGK
jgi:hypothetical protein